MTYNVSSAMLNSTISLPMQYICLQNNLLHVKWDIKSCSLTYCYCYFLVVSKVDDVVDSVIAPSSVIASADVTCGTQDDINDLSLTEVKCYIFKFSIFTPFWCFVYDISCENGYL